MVQRSVLEQFEQLLIGVDDAWQGDSPEPAMVALLQFIKANAQDEELFRQAFVQMALSSRSGPLEAVAFCMHELRWPAVLEAAKKGLNPPHPRSMNLLGRLIDAYDDDWADRDLYEYYSS